MQIDLTQIVLSIIALIGTVLTGFVIPILKVKLLSENSKLSENQQMLLKATINTAVTAAEQIYKSDEGLKKKAYVLSILEQQGYKANTSAIDAAVEAAVFQIKKSISE